jgi:hypothetical protein
MHISLRSAERQAGAVAVLGYVAKNAAVGQHVVHSLCEVSCDLGLAALTDGVSRSLTGLSVLFLDVNKAATASLHEIHDLERFQESLSIELRDLHTVVHAAPDFAGDFLVETFDGVQPRLHRCQDAGLCCAAAKWKVSLHLAFSSIYCG